MDAEAKTLLTIMLLLLVIGIWDALAIAYYVGSSMHVLAGDEGFNSVCVSFNPPKSSTLLISYEIFVEPNPSAIGDKYARLKIILYDSTGNILWADEVYKGVKTTVSVASDSVAIDIGSINGLTPYRTCVVVDKVTWGTLEKLRVEIKYNPYLEPRACSIWPLVEIFTAIFLPFLIIIALPKTLTTRYCKGRKALLLVLAIVILYIMFRYTLHQILGIHINLLDYIKILFFIE